MNLRAEDSWTGESFARWGSLAIGAVIALAVVTGGGASDRGLGDALTQLLALPLLVWSIWVLCSAPGQQGGRLRNTAIVVAGLVAAVVAMQLLPLSDGMWRLAAPRAELAADLQAAGVEAQRRWSLAPLATERALWSLAPALAVFLGTLAVPVAQRRRLALWVVGLGAASLLLGYLQLGAPQDSPLNPFPQWAPALNGFFANPNHQAMLVTIALVLIVALLLDGSGGAESALPRWARFGLAAAGLLMLVSLPLTGSRAVLLIAVLALTATPLLLRGARGRHPASARTWVMRIALGSLAVAAIAAAAGWLRHDMAEEVRWQAALATAKMGTAHAPWGAGVGSFVPWFEQAAPAALVQREYFNHAHDEFAQWWLESGVLGAGMALLAVAVLLAAYPRRGAGRLEGGRGLALAAWLACVALLLHSLVDYPLRTPSLMTVAGLLAGIVVAARPRRDVP